MTSFFRWNNKENIGHGRWRSIKKINDNGVMWYRDDIVEKKKKKKYEDMEKV